MSVTNPAPKAAGGKVLLESKTFWVNLLALIAMGLQLATGFAVPPEYQVMALGVVNVLLRTVTKDPIVWAIPLALIASLALSACAGPPPITNNPAANLPGSSIVITGAQNAAWNLDQAISIGVLPKDDPADVCMHGFLQQFGVDQAPGTTPPATQSFTPKITDLISLGSVAYIQAQQLSELVKAGSAGAPDSCDALIGKLVRDAAKVGLKVGGSLVPGLGTIQAIQGALNGQ